jgi:hypothetical protein
MDEATPSSPKQPRRVHPTAKASLKWCKPSGCRVTSITVKRLLYHSAFVCHLLCRLQPVQTRPGLPINTSNPWLLCLSVTRAPNIITSVSQLRSTQSNPIYVYIKYCDLNQLCAGVMPFLNRTQYQHFSHLLWPLYVVIVGGTL